MSHFDPLVDNYYSSVIIPFSLYLILRKGNNLDSPFDSVIIYVFSGTHNTALVATFLKEEFEKREIPTQIVPLGKPTAPLRQPSEKSLVAIGYPIHAFNAPKPVLEEISKLKEAFENQKVFIFKVSGEPLKINDASSVSLFKILKRKNYCIFDEYHFLMPYNIWFRYSNELANHMHLYAKKQSKLVVEKLLNNREEEPKRVALRARLFGALFKIQHPAAALNGKLYTVDRKKCTLCGICEKGCPVGNIRIVENKVTFHNRCAMCMYCSMYCPVDAINIGLLKFWKVNGPYNYVKMGNDLSLPFPFITKKTKGVKKLFVKHYEKLENELDKFNLKQ